MSQPQATYTFLPWLRQGIATRIVAGGARRATVQVDLEVVGEPVPGGPAVAPVPFSQAVELYGPGDVVGIDGRAVVRTEPRNWATNFEPNYLAHIEFYDEDFPWRYTPVAPVGVRLRPWLALVVLTEEEFEDTPVMPARPLPAITVRDLSVFPPGDEQWAWAHVHVNRSLAGVDEEFVSDRMDQVLPRFEAVRAEDPDLALSRLICPRRPAANQACHAFLLPGFEAGRLAALGFDPARAPDIATGAWDAYDGRPDPTTFPVYYRWYFRTGGPGDFEQLVRALRPKRIDPRVGQRAMDVMHPGSNLPAIDDPDLGGVLRLGGALRVPRVSLPPGTPDADDWERHYPHRFQRALARLINLADDYDVAQAPAANAAFLAAVAPGSPPSPDPLITPPLYGRWHARARRLLFGRDGAPIVPEENWVHELNLDPRYRVPAGLGARVVRQNQEEYMRAAWEQLGDVLEANRRIRLGQLAREVARVWYARHLGPRRARSAGRALALTGPVHRRVVSGAFTVYHHESLSHLGTVGVSAALRRVLRPRGRIVRAAKFDDRIWFDDLWERMGRGEVRAAPPKQVPLGLLTPDRLAGAGGEALAVIPERAQTRPSVDRLPRFADFFLTEPNFNPPVFLKEGQDSLEGSRFKDALRGVGALLSASAVAGHDPDPAPLDVPAMADAVVAALNPDIAVPRRVLSSIRLPAHAQLPRGNRFDEIMAYPRIDRPMYEPLAALSPNLFLPNLHLIEDNSLTLLETNQKFIEAYMVGLNYEFHREFLWRGGPTNLQGTCFRQCWNPRGFLDTTSLDPDALRERLYDIPELHRWAWASRLGDHDHREAPGAGGEEVVLVIRGELLRRYPTAVIYARRAEWQLTDGVIDPKKERTLSELTADEEASPPRDKVRTPLYEAKVAPDIHFLGFDLSVAEAKGGSGSNPADRAGWFFVIEERPGEPRFGLDVARDRAPVTFNDLAWSDVAPGPYLRAGALAPVPLTSPGAGDGEKASQHDDDVKVNPSPVSSARWAYLLFQAPVMVAVHAAEMLRAS